MNRYTSAAISLSTALGMAIALQAPVYADDMPAAGKDAMKVKMEHCYGVNAVAKNDCAEGAHSCAGQATVARDPKSFVLLPVGACSKIAGGNTKSM